jgi:ArsR family transcriptional regulator
LTGFETLLHSLRALAEPTRLRLVLLCARSELTVSELTRILGQSQPRISRHLKLLCEADILERVREGTWSFYRLSLDGAEAQVAGQLVGAIMEDDEAVQLDFQRLEDIRQTRNEAALDYFRRNASAWDEIRALHTDDAAVEEALREMLPDPTDANEDLLDVGTGTGWVLFKFGACYRRVLGIDLSREMLAVARAKLENEGMANCRVRQGDMYSLPVASESFDVVTFHHVLHFAEHPQAAIAEAARVLRPMGSLAIIDFAPHDLNHLRSEHAHRRLGLADADMEGWCAAAGLAPTNSRRLPGRGLTTVVWLAHKPGKPGSKPMDRTGITPVGTIKGKEREL